MSLNDPVNEIEMHQRNVRDMQKQLQEAYMRINVLSTEVAQLKQRIKNGEGTTPRDHG